MKQFDLLCCIVNNGSGTKVLRLAKEHGVHGGTIFMGRGTAHHNRLLEFLELTDTRKEVVMMLTERGSAIEAMNSIGKELQMERRYTGICFSFPIKSILGIRNLRFADLDHQEAVDNAMYNAIFTIVEKGQAEEVIEAAVKAGARGGTIINARGSGVHDTDTIFSMPIEPEREIILIIAPNEATGPISKAIRRRLDLDEAQRGVLFTLGVSETFGLADNN